MTEAKTAYTGGRIYEIVCKTTGRRYIGKTTLSLHKRLICHRAEFNNYLRQGKNIRPYSVYSVLEANDYEINQLEWVDTDTNIFDREGYYQQTLDCVNNNMNTGKSSSANAEYRASYYESNKERINSQAKKRQAERILCPHCDKDLSRGSFKYHRKNVHKNIPLPPPIPMATA